MSRKIDTYTIDTAQKLASHLPVTPVNKYYLVVQKESKLVKKVRL